PGERAGEQPREVLDAAGHTHLVADGSDDVVGGQDGEEVQPRPSERGNFRRAHVHEELKRSVQRPGRRFGGGGVGNRAAYFGASRHIQRRMSGKSAPPWASEWAPSPQT